MSIQNFRSLHKKGNPLILYNIWDAGSAKAICETGAKVIATSSLAVAKSQGFEDGENIPLNFVLENFSRIIKNITVPLTVDFEGGYSNNIAGIKENIKTILEIGVIGLNFEDGIIGGKGLYSISEQSERIAGIRSVSSELFINARCDLFFESSNHDEALIQKAIERAIAYHKAGADCFFAPMLQDIKLIKMLCEASPIPVNIMLLQDGTIPISKELIDAGVSRISYGPMPYFSFIKNLQNEWQNKSD